MDIIGSADLRGDRQWHRQNAGEEIHQHGGTQARGVGDDGVLVGEENAAFHGAAHGAQCFVQGLDALQWPRGRHDPRGKLDRGELHGAENRSLK